MLTIVFYQDNNRKVYSVPEGITILEVARKKNIDIEGSCQGSLACSTCHILISKKWINKIYPAKIEEKEM